MSAENATPAGAGNNPGYDGPLMNHSYDGIMEFDNPLPSWWSFAFIATIIWSAAYGYYYHFGGPGQHMHATYDADLQAYSAKLKERTAKELASISEESLSKAMADAAVTARGGEVFKEKCVACHLAEGQGLVGPNLTDNFQIHGTTRMDIYKTVRGGIAGTAMIAWSDQLSEKDVLAVAAYAAVLRGKNVAGKASEGKPVTPF